MKTRAAETSSAFSLVEVTLALGVAGFCLLAIFGLLPVALSSNQAAIEQTAADSVMLAVIADLRATPSTSSTTGATSGQYAIKIPAANAANGTAAPQTFYFVNEQQTVATAITARYRVTLNFLAAPAGGGIRSAACMNVKVSWPAITDPAVGTPAGAVQTFAALDRN